jgi:hypothetical protein
MDEIDELPEVAAVVQRHTRDQKQPSAGEIFSEAGIQQ